ncbi:MAG TPA: GTP-binding protein [Nitrososphaerales archaeon]|nr:GTP-binding protein [Nitrososphaerales archaeon]
MAKITVIMGAAGRDFDTFNVYFRDNPEYNVVAFTATQIPYIADRTYPASLAGRLYPKGIPIVPQEELEELIRAKMVSDVYFAYSDVSDTYVMDLVSKVQANGASFHLLGPDATMLRSKKPVVAVVADRTGAGKSTISRMVAKMIGKMGLKPVVIRHPMPYGDLSIPVQRFATYEDLDRYHATIEEREEYEGHIDNGMVVYAGVDYGAILEQAEKEGDVILWDGGNNDFSFYWPDLNITVVDPLRMGDEASYYPGKTNVRMADIIVINKVNVAPKKNVEAVAKTCAVLNRRAAILRTNSEAVLDKPELVKGKKVLVVEDGPSVTHGGLSEGAGAVAARAAGGKLVSPKDKAVGSIRKAYERFPQLGDVLPALGYSDAQLKELEKSINSVVCDAVVLGTPSDIRRMIRIKHPVARVTFEASEVGKPRLEGLIRSNRRLAEAVRGN